LLYAVRSSLRIRGREAVTVSLPPSFGERISEYLDRISGNFYVGFVLSIGAEARPVCSSSIQTEFI
jgi:hypothetical protein